MMRKRCVLLWVFIFLIGVNQVDAQEVKQVKGRVVDAVSGDPIAYATLILKGTGKGTVSNTEGNFILKIPSSNPKDSIVIASLGYVNRTMALADLKAEKNIIRLYPARISFSEVLIRPNDARSIVEAAIQSIRKNYSDKPYMMTAFYRESVKRRRKYLTVSEAVLDVYKAAYTKRTDKDRIKILKARKTAYIQKKDTIALKLKGGPFVMLNLDFVKNPSDLLSWDDLDYYQYSIAGFEMIDNKLTYVISFESLPSVELPWYSGKFYISMEDMAFVAADFYVSKQKLGIAGKYMVTKKPAGVSVQIEKARYHTSYRYYNGKWYLSYIRYELGVFVKWKRRHFRSKYFTTAELAVTDMDTVNITRFKKQNNIGRNDVFIEKVSYFEDPDFWGDYNIIRPEEPIQVAIKKMGRKLKRKAGKQ